MSSNLVGIDVYSKQNDKIGKIEDLAIEGGKVIKGLVVSVGGFLGVGEKYVLIDPATVTVNEQDGKWKAFVDMSKDALKSAPEFKYNKGKS
jgi:sporulation protein YlmC with PRC-barrel domain